MNGHGALRRGDFCVDLRSVCYVCLIYLSIGPRVVFILVVHTFFFHHLQVLCYCSIIPPFNCVCSCPVLLIRYTLTFSPLPVQPHSLSSLAIQNLILASYVPARTGQSHALLSPLSSRVLLAHRALLFHIPSYFNFTLRFPLVHTSSMIPWTLPLPRVFSVSLHSWISSLFFLCLRARVPYSPSVISLCFVITFPPLISSHRSFSPIFLQYV